MAEQFQVVDRDGKVIETFASKKEAKTFATDFRKVFHCPLPKVQKAETRV